MPPILELWVHVRQIINDNGALLTRTIHDGRVAADAVKTFASDVSDVFGLAESWFKPRMGDVMAERCMARPEPLMRAGLTAGSISTWANGLAIVLEKDGALVADMVQTALKMYADWSAGTIDLTAVFVGFNQEVRDFTQIAADIRAAFAA